MSPPDPRAGSAPPESFAALLRRLREARGLTQEELAARAGLTVHGVSALERGVRRRPYPHTVRSLAGALDSSAAERAALLSAGAGPGPAGTPGPGDRTAVLRGLPAPVTALLGRDDDVAAVAAALVRSDARLVTLTGTGGVGKTRLALAVAERTATRFADGVAFVALAAVDDPALVLPAIGRVTGLPTVEDGDLDGRVVDQLRGAHLLLVLDNLEHLPGAVPVVARLLEQCPRLGVLATSRAALRLRGEWEHVVHPLALPPTAPRDLTQVASAPAGALLLDRARAVSPEFGSGPGGAAAVAALCRRLAGIPLALELAAARARVLDAAALLERLDDAMSRDGAADLPPRQRTMRATLDWSHRLLDPADRLLLQRLAVFTGGCTLEAVEAVAADLADPLGSLERLVEHSLVEVSGEGGARRYGMLEPVLQFARSLLDEQEARRARTAHAAFYLDLAEQAAPGYQGAEQVGWLDRAERDAANLAAAVEWWLQAGDGARAGRMAWALWLFWWLRGRLRQGRRLAEAALEQDQPAEVRVRTVLTAASMAFAQGDLPHSGARWAEAADLAVASGDVEGQAYAFAGQGLAALGSGAPDRAEPFFAAALAVAEQAGPAADWVAALTHVWLGTVRQVSGDPRGAVPHIERGLASARRRGDRLATYVALFGLVQAELAEGRPAAAREHLVEGIELSEQTGDLANLAFFVESLAVVEGAAGAHDRAAVLLGAAHGLRERVGSEVYGYYLPDPALRSRAEAQARAALGDPAVEDALATGQDLDVPAVLALALRRGTPTG
ncbi:Transcriptional regulator, winged helix family (fragment) [Modestobacter italicus]|uniref:Transcriptional regulator, winged helix family n=1 Tax=Modestobacter italicus (strain DSM 44449 / CECT 9708 / BC 501) TaxID=2732864 RepID=I4ETA3_MODI5